MHNESILLGNWQEVFGIRKHAPCRLPKLVGTCEADIYNSFVFPAIFLDRDGVIIENRDAYVRSWDDVYIYPQALKALAKYASIPYKFIIVTNQSAVGRGIISQETAVSINNQLVKEIKQSGGEINAVFMCPHSPSANCNCRKPEPGMFYQAAEKLSLDLNKSIMVGDALTDMLAAQNAGIKQCIFVRTGRGEKQLQLPKPASLNPFLTFDTLLDAFVNYFQ